MTPSEQEVLTLNTYELTSPAPFDPEESVLTRKDRKRKYNSYPGELTMTKERKVGLGIGRHVIGVIIIGVIIIGVIII